MPTALQASGLKSRLDLTNALMSEKVNPYRTTLNVVKNFLVE